MISKFSRQFFWLFFIIGILLSIFLWANEYFLHQISVEEYDRQQNMCVQSGHHCEINRLIHMDGDKLNANQNKIIELHEIISNYELYLKQTLITFLVLMLLGVVPGCIDVYKGIYYKIKSWKMY